MTTINISLPKQLKNQAEVLVRDGFYASFSDLVRASIRRLIAEAKYDIWLSEAKLEEKMGKAKVLKSKKDIDDYVKSL